MTHYVYILKCPDCEDEFFDFFEDAKICALRCLSDKPIITQTEVNRNDFGECTDHCDLGTVWSWEEALGEPDKECDDTVFSKADTFNCPECDPEFDDLDNSIDPEIEEISDDYDTVNEWVDSSGKRLNSITTSPTPQTVTNQTPVSASTSATLDQLAKKLGMFDTNKSIVAINTKITAPYSKEKMAYGNSFMYGDMFTNATGATLKEVRNKTGVNLHGLFPHGGLVHGSGSGNVKIWTYNDDNNILLVHFPNFNFIIDKNDFIAQLSNKTSGVSGKPIPEGMTIEELVEAVEENEDTVECTKCGGLFEKARCTHNKEGFGWCCSNCEPADTLTEDTQEEYDLAEFVRDSIDHLTNDLGKDPWADDFADDVIADLENNYDIYVPEDMAKYGNWCHSVASEVSRQVNKSDSMLEELENAEAYRERLVTCPECGDKSYDTKLLFCINCGFNQG